MNNIKYEMCLDYLNSKYKVKMSLRENSIRCKNNNISIHKKNLVIDTFGNASLRFESKILIKPSGIDISEIKEEEISIIDLITSKKISGKKPSSDTPTHLEIYRAFPEIGGIVHTHSLYATAWAQAAKSIPCYGTTHADYWKREVPITRQLREEEINGEYEAETGKVIIETLKSLGLSPLECPGILVAYHGPFTWGSTIEEAVRNAEILEYVARMAWITKQISPEVGALDQTLHQRHFSRKHGPNAYYGQSQ